MMRAMWRILACALCLSVATAARAVDYAEHVTGSGPVRIESGKAYILFRSLQKTEFRFLRLPSERDRADLEKERAAAYLEATKRKPDLKEADFDFPNIEDRFSTNTAIGKFLEKQGDLYIYLIAVTPGRYVLYGHMWRDGPGDLDTCFCLGTVSFDAPPGKVVDLGRLTLPDDWDLPPPAKNPAGIGTFAVQPVTGSPGLTARLQGLPVQAATFEAAEKMPNTFGVAIDRLAPLPGVLEYDRDRIVNRRN